jgi:hypothetical protein
MMMASRLRVLSLLTGACIATATVACGGGDSPSGATPGSGPALAGTSTGRTAAVTSTGNATLPAGATPPSASGTAPAGIPDGNYAFDLTSTGVTAQLLLATRNNALVVSQLTLANHTGSGISAVPRIRYLDPQQRTFDAITEPDWRNLYPADSAGLADGKTAQIRVGFNQPFDPTTVTFCMNLGPQDLGCFARRERPPVATP